MALWQTTQRAEGKKPYARFPVWIDLNKFKELSQDEERPAIESFALLAGLCLSNLTPKWLIEHLQTEPSLILLDNWEHLPPAAHMQIVRLIAEVSQALPESVWLISTGQNEYGTLIEVGFVPLELLPPTDDTVVKQLYAGWATLFKQDTAIPEAVQVILTWAQRAGASLLELNLRTYLYLKTQQLPELPIEVMDYVLDVQLPVLNLGEEQQAVAEQARTLAMFTLSYIAKAHRLENREFTRQDIQTFIAGHFPPETELPPKLESSIFKLLNNSGIVKNTGKVWTPTHYLWEDFLTAWQLVDDDVGADLVKTHLDDPSWTLLLEFYAATGDATAMVHTLLQDARTYNNTPSLLRAARWSAIVPENLAWRKTVLKALAQTFVESDMDIAMRLQVGRNLALSAGEGALAFFLQALRHPETGVRCVALRGIGWTGGSREMALLGSALKEEDLAINKSAIEAIADVGTAGAARLLYQDLYETDEQLIIPIATALAKIPEGAELLRDSVEDEDILIRRAAAHGLELVSQPWATAALEKLAREDSEWLVRSAAETALKSREAQSTEQVVVLSPPKIDEIDWLISWAAGQGLGLGVGKAAARMLIRAIAEGDAETKILGVLTLTYRANLRHLEILKPLLEDENLTVRQVAAHAIEKIEQRYHIYQGT
jgi:HEAT repeat protein